MVLLAWFFQMSKLLCYNPFWNQGMCSNITGIPDVISQYFKNMSIYAFFILVIP